MTPQRLEEWLKAPADQTAQGDALDFDLANSGRTLDLVCGRRADETHLDSLDW